MKKLLFAFCLLLSAFALKAQQIAPYNRTTDNRVYADRATLSHFFMGIPHGPTPGFPAYVPDSVKCGALYYRTTDSSLYVYNCEAHSWESVKASVALALAKSKHYADSLKNQLLNGTNVYNGTNSYNGQVNFLGTTELTYGNFFDFHYGSPFTQGDYQVSLDGQKLQFYRVGFEPSNPSYPDGSIYFSGDSIFRDDGHHVLFNGDAIAPGDTATMLANVVHKSGFETVTGQKAFANKTTFQQNVELTPTGNLQLDYGAYERYESDYTSANDIHVQHSDEGSSGGTSSLDVLINSGGMSIFKNSITRISDSKNVLFQGDAAATSGMALAVPYYNNSGTFTTDTTKMNYNAMLGAFSFGGSDRHTPDNTANYFQSPYLLTNTITDVTANTNINKYFLLRSDVLYAPSAYVANSSVTSAFAYLKRTNSTHAAGETAVGAQIVHDSGTTGTTDVVNGVTSSIVNKGTGAITDAFLFTAGINSSAAANFTIVQDYTANNTFSAGGTVSSLYGFRVSRPAISGGSAITHLFGFYVDSLQQSGIGTAYAFYSAGKHDTVRNIGSTLLGDWSTAGSSASVLSVGANKDGYAGIHYMSYVWARTHASNIADTTLGFGNRGNIGMQVDIGDDSLSTATNRGRQLGLSVTVRPTIARSVPSHDDATAIRAGNGGIVPLTDMIYLAKDSLMMSGMDAKNGITIDANVGTAFRVNANVTNYGLDMAGVSGTTTYGNSPVRLPNNTAITWVNAANSANIAGIKVDGSNNVNLGGSAGFWTALNTGNFTANRTIFLPDATDTLVEASRFRAAVGKQAASIFSATYNGATVALSTTNYNGFVGSGASFLSTATNRYITMPCAGVLRNLYVRTISTQPSSGAMVISVYKNGSDQAITLTIAANATSAAFSDLTHSVTVSAGDQIALEFANAATAASAQIGAVSISLTSN